MAAVTIVENRTNVIGSFREKYFKVNIAASGDTLATGLKVIKWVDTNNPGGVTNDVPSGGTVTFTTGGAVSGCQVRAVGL